jgi:hypothetical protein
MVRCDVKRAAQRNGAVHIAVTCARGAVTLAMNDPVLHRKVYWSHASERFEAPHEGLTRVPVLLGPGYPHGH